MSENAGEVTYENGVPKKVGMGLILGVFLLPIVFGWFVIFGRAGYSSLAKKLTIAWMVIMTLGVWANKDKDGATKAADGSGQAVAAATASPINEPAQPKELTEAQREKELASYEKTLVSRMHKKDLFNYLHQLKGWQQSPGVLEWEFVNGAIIKDCKIGGKYPAYLGWFTQKKIFDNGRPVADAPIEKVWIYVRDNGDTMTATHRPPREMADVVAAAEREGCKIYDSEKRLFGLLGPKSELVFGSQATLTGVFIKAKAKDADEREITFPAIRLSKAVTIDARPNPDAAEETERNVAMLQLVVSPDLWKQASALEGKAITVKGELFHADNGNHHTPALVMVTELTPKQ